MAEKKKEKKPLLPWFANGQKSVSLNLTLPGLICAVGCAGLALTLFFILGILVGRGYQVEQDVPRLAEIMPSKHGVVNPPMVENATQNATQPKPEEEILKAVDLNYPEKLAKAPALNQPEAVVETKKPEAKAAATKPEAAKAEKEAAPAKLVIPEPAPGDPVFDYVYQAASFREKGMADDLAKKLQGSGLVTDIQQADTSSGTWFRVMVRHRGTPQSTQSIKDVLRTFKISKPLLKSKKQVSG